MTDYTIQRNRYGQPYVTTDGGPLRYEPDSRDPVNATAYTRASTLAEVLDDKSGLVDWSAANAAIGVVRDPSLHAQVAHLASAHEDPWNSPEAKQPLKRLVARAQQVAGSESSSGHGTAFHGLADLVDGGHDPEFVPPTMTPWLDAYRAAMADWDVLDAEGFVVADQVQAAGSFDRLLRHRDTGMVVVGDIKTGKSDPRYPLKVTVQTAVYAHGERYDQATGHRAPLHPEINRDRGVLIHVPLRAAKPQAVLYPLDLRWGWDLAQTAVLVQAARRMPKLEALG